MAAMGSEKGFRYRPADFLRGRVSRKVLERTGMVEELVMVVSIN